MRPLSRRSVSTLFRLPSDTFVQTPVITTEIEFDWWSLLDPFHLFDGLSLGLKYMATSGCFPSENPTLLVKIRRSFNNTKIRKIAPNDAESVSTSVSTTGRSPTVRVLSFRTRGLTTHHKKSSMNLFGGRIYEMVQTLLIFTSTTRIPGNNQKTWLRMVWPLYGNPWRMRGAI